MKLQEMKDASSDELNVHEKEMRKELFNLRFQKVLGGLENPMRIRLVRKEIARVKTVLNERKAGR
ncbi:MAG: 50S ribosomal protein L29 [Nitrospirae bacterium]|nr:50S ribosomal protein L29 [Nitrospirota bacterium]